jgi:2',3'-cyclic-nucleotide 2'-phosphodiesterase (5'-nucleotidase family)
MRREKLSLVVFGVLILATSGCGKKNAAVTTSQQPSVVASAAATTSPTPTQSIVPVKVSFFLTNDIHGHVEMMSQLGGIVEELRARPEYKNQEAGLVVVDSGDQFQGTLTSNYDEGETVFRVLNEIGYDAIIPGNHDYDFGPKNWQYDRVTPGVTGNNPREVIEDLAGMANFPMISANTYIRNTVYMAGTHTPVAMNDSCVPTSQSLASPPDFVNAKRPAFLSPYKIIMKAGVRIALIGIDHHLTTSVTTGENVSDLCFRDEADTYLEVRKSLEGQADVFVMLMHNGNILPATLSASDIVTKINTQMPGAVDLVAAGHTHTVHNNIVNGVHVMQDGCNGAQYGRVDLYFDPIAHKVLQDKTDSWPGLAVKPDTCDTAHAAFACSQLTMPVPTIPAIDTLVANAAASVAVIGKVKLATSADKIDVSRVGESALGDLMADLLRTGAGTQIAFMNAGGLRTSIKKGDFLYENLFEVTPFGNLVVVMDSLPWKNLKEILKRTVKTAGAFGTLEESGLKIRYASSNADTTAQIYLNSELLHVELLDGTVLFDKATSVEVAADKTFSVATLDFLALGGDSYDFAGVTVDRKMKIARDVIADVLLSAPDTTLHSIVDGRFLNTATHLATSATPTPAPTVAPTAPAAL